MILTRQAISRFGHASGVFATRVLFAAALLLVFEILWSIELAYEYSPGRILVWFSMTIGLVLGVEAIGVAVGRLARRAGGRYAPVVIAIVALPLAALATQSLFSGGYISTVRGIVWIRLFFGASLAAGAGLMAVVYGRIGRTASPRALAAWSMALLLAMLWISWADHHVQVGLYPAFHLLLLGGLCWCASLAGRLVIPVAGLPWRGASAASLAAVVAAVALGALTWRSTDATHVVTYTNGVAPKYRSILVAARKRLGGPAATADTGPGIDSLDPVDLRRIEQSLAFRPTAGEAAAAIRAQTRNVVFVLLDALRADHVGRIWNGASLTPNLDRLRAEAVVFANHYSPSDHTARSMPPIMTSLPLPVVNQVAPFEVPLTTWIDVLRTAGFKTFSNGASDYISRKHKHVKVNYCFGAETQGTLNGRSTSLVQEVGDFIAEAGDARFAVYTHWADAHIEVSRSMEAVYRDKVRVIDQYLGELVDVLRQTGRWEDTLLVVTADHGYSLGEGNKALSHGGTIERQVRVPLFLRLPGSGWEGRVVEQNVSGCEIAPTIIDALAPEAGWRSPSRSLIGLMADPGDPRAGNTHVVFASQGREHMVRRGRYKLIWDEGADTTALFDLAADPGETRLLRDRKLLGELRAAMDAEFDRLRGVAISLVSAREQEIDPAVLAVLMGESVSEARVTDVLSRFWSYNAATRRYVLEQIFRREIRGVRQTLDALARDQWEEGDQLLLLIRTYAGSRDARTQLLDRYRDLDPEARRWFGDILPYLPSGFVASVSERLMEDIADLWASKPPIRSPQERYMTMCAYALVKVLKERAPGDAKALLCERYLAYETAMPTPQSPSTYRARYAYNTLREPNFYNAYFLNAIEETLTEDELFLLDGLGMNRAVARSTAYVCLRLSTDRSKSYLLDVLRRESQVGHVNAMSVYLKKFTDDAFRREANAIIQQKFPHLESIE